MKKAKKTKDPLCDAVRKLRTALGESQQAFAYRMKTAIRTIARYEASTPPKGKALAELFWVAADTGNAELANVFRGALRRRDRRRRKVHPARGTRLAHRSRHTRGSCRDAERLQIWQRRSRD